MAKKEKIEIGNEGIYDAKKLGNVKMLMLGLQHTFAMFGATVIVPIVTGLDVSTTLLMAGLGTLLFHLLTKGKVPAFLGSSFAFLGGFAAVAPMIDGKPNLEMLPYACGGIAVAGLVYVIMAALIKTFGIAKIMKFFPPIVTGPIIISIGLTLAPTAVASCSSNWLLAIIAFSLIVICNIWGKGMVKIVPILIGIVGAYTVALIMGEVDFTVVKEAKIFGLALHTSSFAKFSLSSCITIVPIALATIMEHIGGIAAISATCNKNYLSEPGLHRTILGDGLATSMAGLLGGPANTTYGENTGVLALTKVYDPRVMRIAAVVAIILSFFPKIGAMIQTIPSAIIGGISFVLYGMISSIGIRNISENRVDLTKSRNLIIASVILVSALGFDSVGGITIKFTETMQLTLSGLAIAAISGIVLNAILPGNDYNFGDNDDGEQAVSFKM